MEGKIKLPNQKKPCNGCPFRKDCLKGWLGRHKIIDILYESSFLCHNNLGAQCAGHMLMRGLKNDFVNVADRLKIKLHLSGKELVFKNEEDCIKHHS